MTVYPPISIPVRPPNHWEFFGFSGPTNKATLDTMYRQTLNSIIPVGEYNARYAARVMGYYETCLAELAEKDTSTAHG